MSDYSLYEVINKRKSVRKFKMDAMEEGTLSAIRNAFSTLLPLDRTIATTFTILKESETKGGLFSIAAPYYIAVYSEPKEGYLMNAGFMLQQMDLLLSTKEIGCCWLGMAKPNKSIDKLPGMEFVIVLAFGHPAEPVHRSSIDEFKRKTLEEVTSIPTNKEDPALYSILEAARLAPSATNSQPWMFAGSKDSIRVYRRGLNPVTALIYERMNKIDIGIALCHMWAAALSQGRKIDIVRERGVVEEIKGYSYCITVLLS